MNAITKAEGRQLSPAAGVTLAPMRLVEMAIEKGSGMEQLERLMALQERHEANEARRAYVSAMAAFKASPIEITKDRSVGYTDRNGNFVGYKHATLAQVTRILVPALAQHGLSHSWSVIQDGGTVAVRCTLTHEMGHSESITIQAPPDASGKKNAIQQIASTISYLQRYTLLAITGTSTEEADDDGAGSTGGDTQIHVDDVQQTDFYPEQGFIENLPTWERVIKSGRRNHDQVIATIEAVAPLTDEQKQRIRNITKD